MTCEKISQEIVNFPINISDTDLKVRCLNILLNSGIPKNQVSRVIPHSISRFLLKNLPQETDTASLLSCSTVPILNIGENEMKLSSEALRELLASHVKGLKLDKCSLPSNVFSTRDLLSALIETSKINTLIMNDVSISMNDGKILKALGSLMERVVNLRFGSVTSNDSIIQSDEIFIKFARDHLSKNRNLTHVDLRGSDIDVVASCSRRNLQINFAGEMRRWARRLRGLAFETDINACRVLRILNRQCLLIKSICLRTRDQQTVSGVFDNLRTVLDIPEPQPQGIEPLLKLRELCLCGNFRITDIILHGILPSLPALKYLNVAGCAVNFEQYWFYLPASLEELILDECSRAKLLKDNPSAIKQLLKKCRNLIIYVAPSKLKGEDLESLRGLALLNGANSIFSGNYDIFGPPDDGLIAFERRVKELNNFSSCINLF
jgi:hypothetical protein